MWRLLALVGLLSTASLAEAATPALGLTLAPIAADREEEVSFDNEATPPRVASAPRTIPEVETRPWLAVLPLLVLAALAWNVRWRRGELGARYAPPIGGRRAPKGRAAGGEPTEDF